MFKNTKTWIFWECYITFLWKKKKNLNMCLIWQILRNYYFVTAVTFKIWMQKTLDTIIGEAIKNIILLYLSTVCSIIYMSNKLNKNVSVISLELIEILTFLLCISSDMETNWFIWLKMYKITGLLSDPFTLSQEVCLGCLFSILLYIIVAEVLASFINVNKRMKGIQIGDHKIKTVNFANDTTIFLRNITCLGRIQVILKLYEDSSSSKINFPKSHASA